MLGRRRPGVRVTAVVSGAKGTLARISSAIFAAGGLGLSEAADSAEAEWHVAFKVQNVPREKPVRPLVKDILDVRKM